MSTIRPGSTTVSSSGTVLLALLVAAVVMLLAGTALPGFLAGVGPVKVAPKK